MHSLPQGTSTSSPRNPAYSKSLQNSSEWSPFHSSKSMKNENITEIQVLYNRTQLHVIIDKFNFYIATVNSFEDFDHMQYNAWTFPYQQNTQNVQSRNGIVRRRRENGEKRCKRRFQRRDLSDEWNGELLLPVRYSSYWEVGIARSFSWRLRKSVSRKS